jgi:radical SAM protein with 4Fe4S-binding SPASM domain
MECLNNYAVFPKITSAFFILTNQCNLKCPYCFVNQNVEKMPFNIALDATKFLIRNSKDIGYTPNITFFGGEPLLEWDSVIVPLTKYIREEYKEPFNLSITSNCILMTEEKLNFMKENNIGLLFSIDGDQETQDINRPFHSGKGSFDMLIDKIPMILKYYPNMTFRATIHRPTAHLTFDNMKFAIQQGYNNMFFIPNVFDDWSEDDKDILRWQVSMFGDYFIKNARHGKIIHLNNLDRIFPLITEINEAYKNKSGRPLIKHKCGLGTGAGASISPDGKIYACQEMVTNDSTFLIGDIYNGENQEKRRQLASMFNSQKVYGLNNCVGCKLDKVCDGACVANNYLWSKDLNRIPDMYCYWQQILLDEAIRICNILGNEKNELFKNSYFKVRKKVI